MARPRDPHARSALLAAARREFVKAGLLKARIEDITHACGLSKGAFYLHFESKEALFREVVSQLELHFEALRTSREQAYRALINRGLPARRQAAGFIAQLRDIDAREDRRLLELLWDWRDVIDVLLRGTQGTEFEGVMWALLDREAARVGGECRELRKAGLIRDDVPDEMVGMMILGTYLLVARRLSTLAEKPDFEPWVRSLQALIVEGTAPPALHLHRAALVSNPRRKPQRRTSRQGKS